MAADIDIKITKRYLNFPISHTQARSKMIFEVDGRADLPIVIRLARDEVDYWVFKDVTDLKGKTIKIRYEGDHKALNKIYQDDQIAGSDSLYSETNRPQFHFTSRRGWINDPNGLIYLKGEYHLFYQHNPYEQAWENMHWGHAVSKDLVHWTELNDALYPDSLGTMFSGSAIIDYQNTSGFGKDKIPPLVVAYTAANADKQTQCIAYSMDQGRTFTKYSENPVIDSKAKWNSSDTRDPKLIWYEKGKHWVMVLNERDGHSIYTSTDLKNWRYESHVTGFWECPELFELPIDGDSANTKWVMYGASGTYMLGSFNGKVFKPEAGKYQYTTGSLYAAQTFTNEPKGRRVQIGWGRISHTGMPFNGMMLLPTELTLRNTKNGPRLFNTPIQEIEQLSIPLNTWSGLTADEANEVLKKLDTTSSLRIKTTIALSHATNAGLKLHGQQLIDYDLNVNTLNGVFYSPADMTSMELTADIFIDRTSIEVFIDNGAYSYSLERKPSANNQEGFSFWGNRIAVKALEVSRIKSIW